MDNRMRWLSLWTSIFCTLFQDLLGFMLLQDPWEFWADEHWEWYFPNMTPRLLLSCGSIIIPRINLVGYRLSPLYHLGMHQRIQNLPGKQLGSQLVTNKGRCPQVVTSGHSMDETQFCPHARQSAWWGGSKSFIGCLCLWSQGTQSLKAETVKSKDKTV